MNHKLTAGFTLLEVLIALAILAVALSAVLRTTTQHIDNAGYLRDKTLAHWVAMNIFTELQVYGKLPAIGKNTGHTPMANQEWYWTILVSETPDPELRRIDIQVGKQPGESIETLTSFLSLT